MRVRDVSVVAVCINAIHNVDIVSREYPHIHATYELRERRRFWASIGKY